MNRRFFGRKAAGVLAAVGAGLGLKRSSAVAGPRDDDEPWLPAAHGSAKDPSPNEDYGWLIPEKTEVVVQEDGCKYSQFIFQKACGGKGWRLQWTKTLPDGTQHRGQHLMLGNPRNIVKSSERYDKG